MTKLIRIDLYCRDIIVHFGTKSELKKALKKYHDESTVEYVMDTISFGCKGYTLYDSERRVFIMYMPDVPHTAEDLGFLSHEVFHVATAIMENIGTELTGSSEEAYAYLIGYLTRRIAEDFSISVSASA